jgi:hypothetical protein
MMGYLLSERLKTGYFCAMRLCKGIGVDVEVVLPFPPLEEVELVDLSQRRTHRQDEFAIFDNLTKMRVLGPPERAKARGLLRFRGVELVRVPMNLQSASVVNGLANLDVKQRLERIERVGHHPRHLGVVDANGTHVKVATAFYCFQRATLNAIRDVAALLADFLIVRISHKIIDQGAS